MATSIQSKVWSHVNGWWDHENWKVIHAVTCSSDPVCVVKHANRWGIIKIEKLQRLFEPEGCSKQGKQVGVLKIEKQQMQIVDPSKPCEYHANIVKVQDMNTTNETLDLGCMEEMPFVLLDLGPGFLLCSSVGCCSFKHILLSKVLRGCKIYSK